MADAEGLTAHRQAVLVRIQDSGFGIHEGNDAKSPGNPMLQTQPAFASEVAKGKEQSTKDALTKVKAAVRAISAYTLAPYRASIKVNQNENPFDMPPEIKQEVERRLTDRAWSRYPDFVPAELLERLARHAGWKAEGTLAGNGSNELIQATLMVTVGQGARVLICEPTFTLYRQIVTVMGGEVISVPLNQDLQYDIDAIERASHQADVMILCSPNNPTGSRVDEKDLVYLAQNFNGIIVVDEAYQEFSGRTVVPLLHELPNLIVLRTFSKAMAMAGLRVGYFLSSPEITREVHKATLPYNLNVFSATAAEVACEKYELIQPTVDKIISEREHLFDELRAIDGVAVVPSQANFMLAKTPLKPKEIFAEFLSRDILVRDVSKYPMLADYVRISVGSPEENDRLIAALKEILSAN
jgi:histidinol-phosphate aminotransferase